MKNSSQPQWDGHAWTQTINGITIKVKPEGDGVQKTWHKNGLVASEHARVAGVIEGMHREWHENGVLAKEVPFNGGKVDGRVRQWNQDGSLLGEYVMSKGKGIEKVWNSDGSLQLEREQITEHAVRGRAWDDLKNCREFFLWEGKPISRSKWLAKVQNDSMS